ncbi:CpaF family protein, partial [bacterium]|nr:CpaF family protein [bacterium]
MFTNRPALKKDIPIHEIETQHLNDEQEKHFYIIRDAVQQLLINNNDGNKETSDVKKMIETCFSQVLEEKKILFNKSTHDKLLEWVIADIVGYGPLEPLLNNPDITEIMVNGHDEVFVERFGLIEATTVRFENDQHLRRVIDRIVSPIGRRVDETSPMVDARLPNGYRVNATIPPLSLDGPILTIRK